LAEAGKLDPGLERSVENITALRNEDVGTAPARQNELYAIDGFT